MLPGLFVETGEARRQWEWHALVTNLTDEPWTIGPLYRERGDCENLFDEMKNQWGWCGFTMRNLTASAIMAALVATVANWWNAFAWLGKEGAHHEGDHVAAAATADRRQADAPRGAGGADAVRRRTSRNQANL